MLSDEIPPPTASVKSAPEIGPVRPKERIETIDILRGWAIFGMVVANVWGFQSFFFTFPFQLTQVWTGTADQIALWLLDSFVSAKFWSLFSFLFGLGFAIQMMRAEARGVRFVSLYSRRLVILFLIGLMQFLLGPSSILPSYAIVGFLLLLLRARSPRIILVVAFASFIVPHIPQALELRERDLRRSDPQTAQQVVREDAQGEAERKALREQIVRVYSEGTGRETLAYNAQRFARRYSSVGFYLGLLRGTFPLFLLGLYVGRRRIFENIPAHLPFMRKVLWWSLGLGLLNLMANAAFLLVWTNPVLPPLPYFLEVAAEVLWRVGAPALGFFYAAVIILLVQREAWKHRLAPLAAVGRVALSNYLLHTLILLSIFHNFGLGLFGQIGPAVGVALAVLLYVLQVLLSMWWTRRFRFGPAEWLWRTLTYGKLQPMRVQQT